MGKLAEDIGAELDRLQARNLRRHLRQVASPPGRVITLDGAAVLNFSSNSYLDLANHPTLKQAAIAAVSEFGTGSTASRLIVGNHRYHEELEAELAAFHRRDATVLFNSGYNANLGVVAALTDARDEIFSDALNHASLIDGCRLSRAHVHVYPHSDMAALADMLAQSKSRRRIVVSESVFSMDGDVALVADLAAICQKYDAALILDEAHAVGALGPGGRGIAAAEGVIADVHVGTMGKAWGSFGAYAAAEPEICDWLHNRVRPFVFTTSLPPAVIAANRAALSVLSGAEGDALRARLGENIAHLARGLAELKILLPGAGRSPIFPVMVGDDALVMECTRRLLRHGIYAQGIRPPTVPMGTSRLRFTLMVNHTAADIAAALEAIQLLQAAGLLMPPDNPIFSQAR